MRIRLNVSISGLHGSYGPGEEVDWPDEDVDGLIEHGYAERLEPIDMTTKSAPTVETAAAKPDTKKATTTPKRTRRKQK